MFTYQQIEHFQTFGYVVLPGLLDEEEAIRLRAEVSGSLTDAYGGLGTDDDPDGSGGIRGDYLPLSVDAAPLSQSLIADDPRLYQGSVGLSGGPTVPTVPLAICFTTNPGWHVGDRARLDLLRHAVLESADWSHAEYDRGRWPAWSEWAAGVSRSWSRRTAVQRLHLLGVLPEGHR